MAEPGVGRMVALIREQAEGCGAFGSPLYEFLLQQLADDVEAGGPAYDVLRGHEDDPGPSALALRLVIGTSTDQIARLDRHLVLSLAGKVVQDLGHDLWLGGRRRRGRRRRRAHG